MRVLILLRNSIDWKMLVPLFTLSLNQKILPGRVTIGRYDGAHACLTGSTTADKVWIFFITRAVKEVQNFNSHDELFNVRAEYYGLLLLHCWPIIIYCILLVMGDFWVSYSSYNYLNWFNGEFL